MPSRLMLSGVGSRAAAAATGALLQEPSGDALLLETGGTDEIRLESGSSSDLTDLTELSVPDLADMIYVVDDPAGTPLSRKMSLNRLLGLRQSVCEGRLTLVSGQPLYEPTKFLTPSSVNSTTDIATFSSAHGLVTGTLVKHLGPGISGITAGTTSWILAQSSTTVSFHSSLSDALSDTNRRNITSTTISGGASLRFIGVQSGTLYFTPYVGNWIGLYDGTRWKVHSFTERSLTLVGLTSGTPYDVFIYDNAGTLTLELSAAWADDNTRTDALATQDGILVKSGAPTRRWLGIIYPIGTNRADDSERSRHLLNGYNQVPRSVYICPSYRDDNASTTFTHGATGGEAGGWTDATEENVSGAVSFLSDGRSACRFCFQASANAIFRVGLRINPDTPSNIVASSGGGTGNMAMATWAGLLPAGQNGAAGVVFASATTTAYSVDFSRGSISLRDVPLTHLEGVVYG